MEFDMPKDQSSIIKVIGVGGGGSNAVNHMYSQGIKGVDFMVCNTDAQALDISPVPIKIQLGSSLTKGRGAGSIPEVGRNAAIENIDDIKEVLENNTTMVFVTAGMGGGTGTGAAPVIANTAREMGILTVGIVTIPFAFEGRKRTQQAAEGLRTMRDAVDTLLVIRNDKLREIHGNLSLQNAFAQADNILTTAAKGIAELISVTGAINVDMNDVNTVMRDSGVAIMGQAAASGEDRAIKAARSALESPLLNDNDIEGAKYILLNITYGEQEVMMDEISDITDFIQHAAGSTADVIWGHGKDESLGKELSVTIIATGFKTSPDTGFDLEEQQRVTFGLEEENAPKPREVNSRVTSPTGTQNTQPAEGDIYLKTTSSTPEQKEVKNPEQTPQQNSAVERFDLNGDPQNSAAGSAQGAGYQQPARSEQPQKQYFSLTEEEPQPQQQPQNPQAQSHPPHRPPAETPRNKPESPQAKPAGQENLVELSRHRMRRIEEITTRIKSPAGITELEKEPAYKRRNISLDDVPHSSQSEVSRYSLSDEVDENGNRKIELRQNNSFLHDNVD